MLTRDGERGCAEVTLPEIWRVVRPAHGWEGSEPATALRPRAWVAGVWVVVLFAVAEGPGTVAGVVYLVDGSLPAGPRSASETSWWVLTEAASTGAVALAAIVSIRLVEGPGRWLAAIRPRTRGRDRVYAHLFAVVATLLLLLIAFAVAALAGGRMVAPVALGDDGGFRDAFDLATSWMAGPREELAVLVAPLVILRAAGLSWRWVVPVLVVLRLVFHVYYGWGVVFLAVWAAGVIGVYCLTRSLLGVIVAHSVSNLSVSLRPFSWTAANAVDAVMTLALGVLFVWIFVLVLTHDQPPTGEPQAPAA